MLETLFESFDSLLVLDTETTGFSPRRDEIIELAMLRLTADGTREEYVELIRLSPGTELPARITELTGITEDDLSGGVSKDKAARAFAAARSLARKLRKCNPGPTSLMSMRNASSCSLLLPA